ncbi:hypothetical protein E2320_019552, partial [Naja naja]
ELLMHRAMHQADRIIVFLDQNSTQVILGSICRHLASFTKNIELQKIILQHIDQLLIFVPKIDHTRPFPTALTIEGGIYVSEKNPVENIIKLVQFKICKYHTSFLGELCESKMDSCLSQPCGTTSICEEGLDGHSCFCAPGFIGVNCDIEVNECLSDPCRNGATCINQLNAFNCLCSSGFEGIAFFSLYNHYIGTLCEINTNECHSNPCIHNGTCTDLINGYSCICLSGFAGKWHESFPMKYQYLIITQLLILGMLVLHFVYHNLMFICIFSKLTDFSKQDGLESQGTNGTIINWHLLDLLNHWLFNYLFKGMHCESDLDECASFPCKNGGTCVDQPGNYSCQCVAPFKGNEHQGRREGSSCEFKPCEGGNPCENGAVCLQELDLTAFPLGFQCQCIKGFAGPCCEININECSSSPCVQGYCYDVIDGFYCFCNPGYAGQICDQDIDNCIINECKHNSTCMDLHL